MAQLILSTQEQRFFIQKRITTVGTEPLHDIVVPAQELGLLFTLSQGLEGQYEIIPSKAKIRLNGTHISKKMPLKSCDRIEWEKEVAVFLKSVVPVSEEKNFERGRKSWGLLQNIANALLGPASLQSALYMALEGLIDLASAESGFILAEIEEGARWDVLVSKQENPSRKQAFSNTILKQALEKREPVCIESMIGHPLASAESVIASRIFSAACLPLLVGDRVIGAVYLASHSPGKSIKRESLPELNLVASQAALVLALETELKNTRVENKKLKTMVTSGTATNFIYDLNHSTEMRELEQKIAKFAPTPLSVVIRGETGTGKEVVARELHLRSDRRDKPFVAINCGAIPETLLESILFGHEKGAFTGASQSQMGKFQQAHQGTIFLDEIGDLPHDLQVKLLRVLQERRVEPLGAKEAVDIDVRILSATHQDLENSVRSGKFRQDLYYRLMGASLKIPALRERACDIPVLSNFFLQKAGSALSIHPKAADLLLRHTWPGNVRELEQVVTRASYMASGDQILPEDIDLLDAAVEAPENRLFWKEFENIPNLKDAQLAFTREYVQRMLDQCQDNRAQAAFKLGISERTLYRLMAAEA